MKELTRKQKLDAKIDEIIYNMCNLVDEIVEAEKEEDYIRCSFIKNEIDELIIAGATQIQTIGCDISITETMRHFVKQYVKILNGVRNFDNIYIENNDEEED